MSEQQPGAPAPKAPKAPKAPIPKPAVPSEQVIEQQPDASAPKAPRLDKLRPYGTIFGVAGRARYEQDGKLFDTQGTCIE